MERSSLDAISVCRKFRIKYTLQYIQGENTFDKEGGIAYLPLQSSPDILKREIAI